MAVGATKEQLVARDGTSILVRRWSVAGEPWAAMLLVHGLAEHSGRYDHVGRQLAAAGVETLAADLRGFGGSGGARATIDRWSQLHDDLEERLVALRAEAPALPIVLYGHSMGGLIILGYVLDGRARPDLLVLSAPAIEARIPRLQRLAVTLLAGIAPGRRVSNGIDPALLSCDPTVRSAYRRDPLCVHSTALHFAREAFAEQARVARSLDRLTVPALVVHGELDTLVPPAVSLVLEGRAGVTRRVYPGLMHELHNEPTGPAVVDDLVEWVRERVSRIPRHAAQPAGPASAPPSASSGPLAAPVR